MRLIPWAPCSIKLRNFGGNSSSSTQNTENVTQPTTTVTGGSGANAVSTTGAVTFNQESPAALNSLDQAVQTTGQVALAALAGEQATSAQTQGVLGKAAATPTEQITPIIIAVAVIAGILIYFKSKR